MTRFDVSCTVIVATISVKESDEFCEQATESHVSIKGSNSHLVPMKGYRSSRPTYVNTILQPAFISHSLITGNFFHLTFAPVSFSAGLSVSVLAQHPSYIVIFAE